MANDGLLTRGYENTGIANAITAAALNQASANAYLALLDTQNDLAENDLARAEARTDALENAAELERNLGKQLGEGYQEFYTDEQEWELDVYLQQLKQQAALEELNAKLEGDLQLQNAKLDGDLEKIAAELAGSLQLENAKFDNELKLQDAKLEGEKKQQEADAKASLNELAKKYSYQRLLEELKAKLKN